MPGRGCAAGLAPGAGGEGGWGGVRTMFMYPLLIELRRANARESRRELRRPGVLPSPPLAIEPRRPPEVDSRRSMLKVLGRRDIRR